MTECEQAPPIARDMSRPHWQRSVGNVVMTQMADEVLAVPLTEVIPDIEWIIYRARISQAHHGVNRVWAGAYAVSGLVTSRAILLANLPEHSSPFIEKGFGNYTHSRRAFGALDEGFHTQATFPINLAMAIERIAQQQREPGYTMSTLDDVGNLLRRPDFHTMVDEAAVTKNSYWGSDSTCVTRLFSEDKSIVFTDDGVRFSDPFRKRMKDAMREVNQNGVMEGVGVNRQPSSGCPVRHTRPHFANTPEDWAQLNLLAEHFDKSPEELTAPRPRSIISVAIDRVADALTRYSDQYAEIAPRALQLDYEYDYD